MREIKFRAWDKEKKTMHKVREISFHKDHSMTGILEKGNGRYFFNQRTLVDGSYIDDIVLMQYTGLKDKTGTEIYEGDILKVRFYNPNRKDGPATWYEYLKVVYYEELAQFVTLDKDSLDNYIFPERSMAIGNIYENPELLEVE